MSKGKRGSLVSSSVVERSGRREPACWGAGEAGGRVLSPVKTTAFRNIVDLDPVSWRRELSA